MIVVSLLVFLAVVFTIVAGFHVVGELSFPHASRVRERLAREFADAPGSIAKSPLYKDISDVSLDVEREIRSQYTEKFESASISKRLENLLQQADLAWSIRSLLLYANALGLIIGIAALTFFGPWIALPAALGAVTLPFCYVHLRRNRRRNQLLRQLPSAFDLMARIINAGQSVMQAFHAVADSFDNPISAEFSKCLHEQKLGLRPDVTLPAMAFRSGIMEMRIFAMAMLIQQQSGGKLSEVLQRLAEIVRARVRLRRRVQTLTAEGRMQGWTLVVLPFVAFAAMMFVNREYAALLLERPPLIAATCAAMFIGHLWIRKIINVDP